MILLIFFILSFSTALSVLFFRNKRITVFLTLLFLAAHIAFTVYCWFNVNKTLLEYFTLDNAGLLMLSVLSILCITTIFHGFIYVKEDTPKRHAIYHAALIALITAISGAYLANGLTTVWIFVEATTLAVAALIYHDRTALSLEATWKYVFVCSIGIALAYIGILFLCFMVRDSNLLHLSFNSLSSTIASANPLYLKIAFVFVLVGYSTKMGLFPMHTVTVDAHTVAPAPVSAFISTALMNVGFIAIFRIYALFSHTSVLSFMNNVLLLTGFLSILIAAGYMLKAKHNKRMLAYSSLENMGIVAIALGIGGIGYYAAFLHIILHSFVKAGLFYQIGQSYKVMGTYLLDESGEYLKKYPAGAIALLTGLICITAIPPSGMFISEFFILKNMIFNQQYFHFIVISFLLCFVIYALFTRVLHVLYSKPYKPNTELKTLKVNPWQSISQYLLFGIVIYICFSRPHFLDQIINTITHTLPS